MACNFKDEEGTRFSGASTAGSVSRSKFLMEEHKGRNGLIILAALVALFCLGSVCFIGACGATMLTRLPVVKWLSGPAVPSLGHPTPSTSAPRPSSGSTADLRLVALPPETMDPALVGDLDSARYVYNVFSGLVSLDEELQVRPELAEAWEVSPDGLVYTFHLRHDAQFHDGRPVTAEDVRYSLERACDPATRSRVAGAYLADIVGVKEKLAGQAETIRGVEVLDDYTIRLTIDAPKSYFLSKFTHSTAFVVDREQVESDPEWLRHPNGTGPYRLVEWTDDQIVLEPNPHYYGDRPGVRRVVCHTSVSGSPMTMYETGELDVVPVSSDQIERVMDPANPLNRELRVVPLLDTFYVGLNVREPPFDDPKVRRAFAMGLNRKAIVSVLLKGRAEEARGILPPGMPGYNPDLEGIPYDPEQASVLLAESRYGGPEGLPPITLSVGGSGQLGEALAEMWGDSLGANVDVEVPMGGIGTEWNEGRLQMVVLGWIADYPDPENFLDLLFHSQSPQNSTGYSNPKVDELLEAARAEQDQEKRFALYREAEKLIVQDAPWIPLYHTESHLLVKPYVKDLVMTPQGLYDLRRVRVEAP